MSTLIFNKVFKAEGDTNGRHWVRWDYKTAAGERYVHFAETQELPLEVPLSVIAEDGRIKAFQAETTQQSTQESSGSPEAVSAAPVASQRPSRDFQAEAEGKTRCALVSALLPALFTAQVAKGGDPSPENARVLLEWAFKYVFATDEIPF